MRTGTFVTLAVIAYAVMFWRISVAGVTTGLWGGGTRLLPASPATALAVLGGGTYGAYWLFSAGKR